MGSPLIRNILAVSGGIIVAMTVMMIVEAIGHAIFPPPSGLDLTRPEDQVRLMESTPAAAKIGVAIAWFLGALAGACIAIAVSRHVLMAWIVGLAIALLGLWTTQTIPHPDWMLAASAVLPLVAVLVSKRLMAGQIASV